MRHQQILPSGWNPLRRLLKTSRAELMYSWTGQGPLVGSKSATSVSRADPGFSIGSAINPLRGGGQRCIWHLAFSLNLKIFLHKENVRDIFLSMDGVSNQEIRKKIITRMHSSRMRTVCLLTVYHSVPWGSASRGFCGGLHPGGLHPEGSSSKGGLHAGGLGRLPQVCLRGGGGNKNSFVIKGIYFVFVSSFGGTIVHVLNSM